jgi:tetratricopeptide (TPR) repeat protein
MQKIELYNLSENPSLLSDETLNELRNLTGRYPFFQAAWLLYLKNLKITGNSEFDASLKKAATLLPDRKLLFRFLNSETESKKSDSEQSKIRQANYTLEKTEVPVNDDNLIDKFLSASPGPIRLSNQVSENKHEESAIRIADRSLSENDELITETLAMIYYEQKKYDLAVEAFKKLSLKYPEKNIYFATRIEEIEKLRNI